MRASIVEWIGGQLARAGGRQAADAARERTAVALLARTAARHASDGAVAEWLYVFDAATADRLAACRERAGRQARG